MLTVTAIVALAFPLAVQSLNVRSDPSPKLAQASSELTAADGEEADWPSLRRNRRPYAEKEKESQSRLAVLVSGSVEELLLTPLLSNVVHANARSGLRVDLFFDLIAPTKGAARRAKMDPKVANLLLNFDEVSFDGKFMDFVCQLSKGQGASHCAWQLQQDDDVRVPKNATRRSIMTQQKVDTAAGKAAVARWRSLTRLWDNARAQEGVDEYDAILVARADDYWLAPRLVSIEDFQLDTLQVSTIPCLDQTGINDKAVIMGRQAADVMLSTYEAWQRGDEHLNGTRTAEEVWFRTASQAGLNIVPEPMYAAQALYTQSGLPCFQEATFNLGTKDQRVEQCFAESVGDAPVTSLFNTFSCEAMNPLFYDLLWPQQAQRLQQLVADIANRHESNAIVLTVVGQGEVQAAVEMLTSLQAAGEEAKSLVVGTSTGICKALADSSGVAGHKCLVVVPAQDVRLGVFKHAILTTVAVAGLSDKIVYASPHVTFTSSLTSQLGALDKHIVFAKNATSAEATKHSVFAKHGRGTKACSEESGDLDQIDSGVLYLSDTPEVADMLLRAWERMSEDSKISQPAALAAALSTSGYSDFGFLSCGVHFKEEPEDQSLSGEQAPGTAEQNMRDAIKASENDWVDRFRDEAAKQRRAKPNKAPDTSHHDEWVKKVEGWKEIWAQRLQDLQQENNYNEEEAAEIRRKKRRESRSQSHKGEHKHIRYLPPDEAKKVQAKEDKWKADQEKQKFDDLEKAEARKEEFQRQVDEAQRIIESRKAAWQSAQGQPTESAQDQHQPDADSDELGAA